MSAPDAKRLSIASDADVVRARKLAQSMLQAEGMRPARVTRFATAVSEIARNTLIHGGGGEALFQFEHRDGRKWLRACFTDKGPGIADIAMAMTDGYSGVRSLGLGLGGAKRLSDAFEIDSDPGSGTKVEIACRLI